MSSVHSFLFGVYPYVCLTVFLLGSLIRFDRDQLTWKSDSSQLLRSGMLRWGSNLFHIGILFLFFGHLLGLLTPHAFYGHFLEVPVKQKLATFAQGRTLVLITHRLHSVLGADLVVCLVDGRVVEQGPPAELMQRPGGALRGMLERQDEE